VNKTDSPMRAPQRDIRVARGIATRARLQRRLVIGNSAGFVRGVLARHGGRRPVLRPLDPAFRRPFFAAVFNRHTHRHDQRTNLRIKLGLQPLLRQREIVRPFLAWRVPAPSVPSAAPPYRTPNLVTRILARERRVESATTIRTLVERIVRERSRAEPETSTPPALVRPVPAVPMIVRRPAAPVASSEATRPRPPGRPDLADWGAPAAAPRPVAASTPIPLTPSELGRLTDHVVSAIDRRFTAHRERHGRI
jgi:hypothetical protein